MRLLLLNLLRKPLRTLLTVLSVGIALFLFCFLEIVLAAFQAGVNMADASRLVVQHKESIIFELPLAYGARIEQVEGVTGVACALWFGALSQEPGPDGRKSRRVFRPVRHRFGALPAAVPRNQGPAQPASRPVGRPAGLPAGGEDRRTPEQASRRPARAPQHDLGAEERLAHLGLQRPRDLHRRLAHVRPDDHGFPPQAVRRGAAVRPRLRRPVLAGDCRPEPLE